MSGWGVLAIGVGTGLTVGLLMSGSAIFRVEPIVKCDIQQLYSDAYDACASAGGVLVDTVGLGGPVQIQCVARRDRAPRVDIKELAP